MTFLDAALNALFFFAGLAAFFGLANLGAMAILYVAKDD